MTSLTTLRNSLIAQESYAGKYAIFGSEEFRELFMSRNKDFLDAIVMLKTLGHQNNALTLKRLNNQYMVAADRLFAAHGSDTAELTTIAMKTFVVLDEIQNSQKSSLQLLIADVSRQEQTTLRWTLGLALSGLLLAILIAIAFTHKTFSAVRKLQKATHRIAEGDFAYDPQIPSGDELGDLAEDFSRMASRLKELEQMSLDASPLTRLPGNIAIERIIERRINDKERFALCYADLDSFKSYTDSYGYAKGSELIKLSGEIIYNAVKSINDKSAFVGHIGGDDFIMVLATDKAEAVCKTVIAAFDAEVMKHYSAEDLAKGGIEGEDRYGVHRFFPLMTISIAVIINEPGDYSTSVELAKTAADIKDYVKEKPGSNYLISHRRHNPR